MRKISDEKGYPWLFMDASRPWFKTWSITFIIIIIAVASFFIYRHFSPDISPDSPAGYTYAILGTFFMLLATFSYTRTRRSRQRKVGQLNKALNWHISFGVIAIVMLCLHSFGNLNPRTGTYALYGFLALIISGFVGRMIDRAAPRNITKKVRNALTEQGDDRIETISRTVQEIVTYNTQDLRAFKTDVAPGEKGFPQTNLVASNPISLGGSTLPSSWDIAYISLEETPQEVSRNSQQYRLAPNRKSNLTEPGALLPGYNDQIQELQHVQRALRSEQYYRALIRYWRIFHILLVLLTIGLTIWHLVYAGQLLLPVLLHH
jgi:4-amino-4-deoxy-L-arabinose transferase-like glycosyltransferase